METIGGGPVSHLDVSAWAEGAWDVQASPSPGGSETPRQGSPRTTQQPESVSSPAPSSFVPGPVIPKATPSHPLSHILNVFYYFPLLQSPLPLSAADTMSHPCTQHWTSPLLSPPSPPGPRVRRTKRRKRQREGRQSRRGRGLFSPQAIIQWPMAK